MLSKVRALIASRRVWVAVGGVAFVIFDGLGIGLTVEQINHVALVAGAWIVGDSLRVT